jgi:tripartite-type tricarboxylate transporter receptor subunit TctC
VNVRSLSVLIPAVALLLGMGGAAIGQQYPSRPIRLVVPFPPGGSIDMLSRVLADRLADRLGQPFVVENKAGASGAIGAEFVARAAPDGYTLLTAPTSVYAVGTALNSKMPFDLQKDLAPISTVGITEQSLNVTAALPVTSLAELIAYAKARPRLLNMASQGSGTVSHLACAMLAGQAGIEFLHVPYKGSVQAITDLVSGNVQVMCDSIAASLPQIRAGKLRALAVVGARRSTQLPDVPTVGEAALPGFKVESWTGVMLAAGAPRPVVERLQQEIVRVIAEPAVQKRLGDAGFRLQSSSQEAFAQLIRDDLTQWAAAVKATGATAD